MKDHNHTFLKNKPRKKLHGIPLGNEYLKKTVNAEKTEINK
jgi:hypothetical protein